MTPPVSVPVVVGVHDGVALPRAVSRRLTGGRAGRALAARGVNLDGVRECIERLCRRHP